jgi:hypothetical protein
MAFCTHCGNAIADNHRFCAHCGTPTTVGDVNQSTDSVPVNPQSANAEELSFSSNILLGGGILTPDRLVLTDRSVVYRKRNNYLIGVDESSIPYRQVSSVEIERRIIDADIIIHGSGNKKIVAKNFSVGNAKQIKRLIEERLG